MTPENKMSIGFVTFGALMGICMLAAMFAPDQPKPVVTLTEVEKEREKTWEERRAAQQAAEDHYISKVIVVMPRTYIQDADVSISIIKLANGDCYMVTRGSNISAVTPVNNNLPLLIGTPP